jgi:hypothetical protein
MPPKGEYADQQAPTHDREDCQSGAGGDSVDGQVGNNPDHHGHEAPTRKPKERDHPGVASLFRTTCHGFQQCACADDAFAKPPASSHWRKLSHEPITPAIPFAAVSAMAKSSLDVIGSYRRDNDQLDIPRSSHIGVELD